MNEIKKLIIEKSNLLGFPVIKFTEGHLLTKEIEYLNKWISFGYSSDMDYMKRNIEKRKDVKLLWNNAKTIIVLSYPYSANVDFNGKLKIAKYATLLDYHHIIKKKLNTISNFLFNQFEIDSKCFVDSAPIMEKQWAIKSGLGWQGKNSLIINSKLGSYFHIGIMLIDIDLKPDLQIKERCGNCKLCVESCPTKAIIGNSIIDCNKCIAKWTIEKNTELPANIKTAIRKTGYIFGCDICQDVCPHNKKRQREKQISYHILNEIRNMTEKEFNDNFSSTSLIRTGFKRILMHINNIN